MASACRLAELSVGLSDLPRARFQDQQPELGTRSEDAGMSMSESECAPCKMVNLMFSKSRHQIYSENMKNYCSCLEIF